MITKKQKQVLDFIINYQGQKGYAPSLDEIREKFKLASVSTAHHYILKLEKAGYIKREKNEPRSIELRLKRKERLIDVPLLGEIAAGEPIEAIENKETIKVPESQLSKSGEHYALKVRGNSMIDEGIFDGDVVVIKKQPTAENGETVVALINDNEVTLKKIYKEKNRFRLQPANPNIKPIFTRELIVQGKVTSVIRSFEDLRKKTQEKEEFTDATVKYMEETDIKHRKSFGQYFTPRSIREALVNKLPSTTIANPKILDPGCGTGEFLITAKNHFKNPELHGWDIEKKLVNTAKQIVPKAYFKNTDALLNEDYEKFDFVIGNPPYYEFKPSTEIRKKFKDVINGRVNIFSLFIYQGIKWLKKGGYLAYVVPPSMNNGAYFLKLRKFIVDHSNIEYLRILDDPKLFNGALQSTMLLILRKGKNKGNYLFEKNRILIFSEDTQYLEKAFKKRLTLYDLNHEVKTGRLIWNENKNLLTNSPKEGIPLIWSHNITSDGLKLPTSNNGKPQYVKRKDFDVGPAIVVNRITGSVKTAKLKSAIIPARMKFIAENHVNVIFPPSKQKQLKMGFESYLPKTKLSLENIAQQLSSTEKLQVVRNITGNTQISKTELEKLFPIDTKIDSSG
jgi:adenine-specific DNA-methyltransferase